MITAFDQILKAAKEKGPKVIAVAVAQDIEVLSAINSAKDLGIADAILVGDENEILSAAGKCGVELAKFEVIHVPDKPAVKQLNWYPLAKPTL